METGRPVSDPTCFEVIVDVLKASPFVRVSGDGQGLMSLACDIVEALIANDYPIDDLKNFPRDIEGATK